ncbi:hypothetical protein ZIOFF_060143 [Zingiber officinale]|uniref:BHLH domain-containing protein n=1 Tax=Zingiber officinale TaxID=94328 RepID=A0A8J5KBX7_ZINOF|nr:hypothetical protein ZIOFF_060143 [Zingiber officinale]
MPSLKLMIEHMTEGESSVSAIIKMSEIVAYSLDYTQNHALHFALPSKAMALEAVVFPQDLFGCTMRELFDTGGEFWGYGEEEDDNDLEGDASGHAAGEVVRGQNGALGTSCSTTVQNVDNSSSPEAADEAFDVRSRPAESRRKRQRWRSQKNQEEVEIQRMTHIAVERNRRKQMNEYLAVLRSLMPDSYVQKVCFHLFSFCLISLQMQIKDFTSHVSDQASIIGGAINFVKELEKLVQTLEARKRIKQRADPAPFAELFTFSRYSSSSSQRAKLAADEITSETKKAENMAPATDIEVSMVDSHCNLKVLSPRRPKLLLKLVVGLQNLHLSTLHLNVTTIDDIVFYSFSLKVEEECQLASVDKIATAVHQLIGKIQEEAAFDCTMVLTRMDRVASGVLELLICISLVHISGRGSLSGLQIQGFKGEKLCDRPLSVVWQRAGSLANRIPHYCSRNGRGDE